MTKSFVWLPEQGLELEKHGEGNIIDFGALKIERDSTLP